MLYDRHLMQALFQLQIGNPGSSFAVEIARKIGLPEDVISDASEIVGSEYINADKYLQDIVRDKRYWEANVRLSGNAKAYGGNHCPLSDRDRRVAEVAQGNSAESQRGGGTTDAGANARIEYTIRAIKEAQAEKEKTRQIRQELNDFRESLDTLTAKEQEEKIARKIEKLHIIFEASGIRKGDKIAVCGRNSSHWGVTFLATLTYGAVIVPILHEFKADNVHNIVNHSEAKLLFVGDQVWENLNESAMPLLEGIFMMTDFTLLVSRNERVTYARDHLNEIFGKKFPKNFRKEHIDYHKDQPEELAVINYTSGTTSYSKGVMLPYRSLWSNTRFAFEVLPLKAGDKLVCMLPMAHMYGLAFEFLYEFSVGCHIYYLTRMPSPKIIFQAFAT